MKYPILFFATAFTLGLTANVAFADRFFAGSNCMPSSPGSQEFLLAQDGGLENKAGADLTFIVNCPISFESVDDVKEFKVQVHASKRAPGEFSCVACAMFDDAPDICSRRLHLCSELGGCPVSSDSFVSPRAAGGGRETNALQLTIPGTARPEFKPDAAYAECTVNVGSNLRLYRQTGGSPGAPLR